jgi:hypothetical protein
MKIIRRNAMVVLLSALALLWSPYIANSAQLSQTDQATLVQLEKEAWDVAKQKNWQAYNRLLSQDFIWIDDSGVLLGREQPARAPSDVRTAWSALPSDNQAVRFGGRALDDLRRGGEIIAES